jgi:hypothetical protein
VELGDALEHAWTEQLRTVSLSCGNPDRLEPEVSKAIALHTALVGAGIHDKERLKELDAARSLEVDVNAVTEKFKSDADKRLRAEGIIAPQATVAVPKGDSNE